MNPTNNTPTPESLPPVQTPESHDYLHPITDTQKRTYNPKRVAIVLSAIVAASLIAVIVMLIVALMPAKQSKAPSTPTKQSTAPTKDTITAKQTIEHVKVYFKGADVAKSAVSTPVMAPGKSFYTVIPEVTATTSVAGAVPVANSSTQLASILKSLEYDKFTKRVFADGANNTNYLADFTRSDVTCQVAATPQSDPKADHWFEVRCLDTSQYTEYANEQQPFVSLYTPTTSTATKYGFVGKPQVVASQSAGYNLMEIAANTVIDQRMSALNSKAMFYQTTDGLWHYFRDHTDGIYVECEQYTTPVLKFAYFNQPCRSLSKDIVITVELPEKR